MSNGNQMRTEYRGTHDLIKVNEAAQRLAIGRTRLYGLIAAGAIKSVRIGKKGVRIPVKEIERFVEERLEGAA